jgi:hypothetical protein
LAVPFCGGERMEQWLPDILQALKDHARHNGCSSVEVFGRKGWERVLKPHGYTHTYTTLELEL